MLYFLSVLKMSTFIISPKNRIAVFGYIPKARLLFFYPTKSLTVYVHTQWATLAIFLFSARQAYYFCRQDNFFFANKHICKIVHMPIVVLLIANTTEGRCFHPDFYIRLKSFYEHCFLCLKSYIYIAAAPAVF